jgi:hypothetical protein
MNQRVASPAGAHIDLVGTCLSLACALHCLCVPFFVTVLPLAGVGCFWGDGWRSCSFWRRWH